MKKIICVSIFLFIILAYKAQITQIPTGVSAADLVELSVIGQDIIINDTYGYSMKSNDECNTLTYVALPGPVGHVKRLQRLSATNWVLMTYDQAQMKLQYSTDAGNTWVQKLDTIGEYNSFFKFFDFSEGIITQNSHFMRTNDGCNTWTPGTMTTGGSAPAYMNFIKTYGDSTICIGVGNYFAGLFSISRDRGNTWPASWSFNNSSTNFGNVPSDFFFLNKDSIFGISRNGESSKTINKGSTWINSAIPLTNSYGVTFKNSNEGFVVGSNSQSKGTILKTTDFGKTWWTFNTGYSTTFLNMVFLNDSTALLSGTNGVLLKWKYKKSNFVGVAENTLENTTINIYPNPVKDKLHVEFESLKSENLRLSLINSFGQVVYFEHSLNSTEEIDLSSLSSGLYFLKVQNNSEQRTFKIVKE